MPCTINLERYRHQKRPTNSPDEPKLWEPRLGNGTGRVTPMPVQCEQEKAVP